MILSGPPLPPLPFATLVDAAHTLAERSEVVLTTHRGRRAVDWSGPDLLALAAGWAAACRAEGLRPGDRAVLLLPNDEHFVAAFLGVVLAGAAPVPLAWPGTLRAAGPHVARLAPLVAAADPRLVVTTPGLAASLEPGALDPPLVTAPLDRRVLPQVDVTPDTPAFLQFTSGSTGRPRGVVISHRAAVACAFRTGTALGLGPTDVGLSWLPLFHDMGLVGALLTPLLFRFPLHLMRPGEFLLHPGRWLDLAARHRVTVAAAPDFAWRLAARRVRGEPGNLGAWRIALDGAEPVHRATLDAFAGRFGGAGFAAGALRPSYGLAEHTLGVSVFDPARPAPDLRIDGRSVPSVGRPLPGVEVAISDGHGGVRGGGEVGEILVRSSSVMSGYFRAPAETARVLDGGWLHTGDLGLVAHGQLYVTGRIKDLVIHNGVKLHPYDIERVAAEAAQATPNGVLAFPVASPTGDELVVVVEVPGRRAAGVEERVRGALVTALGIRPRSVLAVAPGSLPRTTSGKLQRSEACARFRSGADGGYRA